jgi:hypothetical protein
MELLIFFSRVAFVCNMFFLIAMALRFYPFLPPGHLSSTIIIAGHVLAVFLNATTSIVYLVKLLTGKQISGHYPRWLFIINFFFLILQLILLFQ